MRKTIISISAIMGLAVGICGFFGYEWISQLIIISMICLAIILIMIINIR